MLPKVSVVVPVYKVEKYIHKCVDSILNQTYENLEVILVDDGSPDQCGAIIDIYAKEDKRIIPLHKENGGLSDARNYGMKYVTGEFTFFVDSDDWLEHSMIETMVMNSIKFQADVVQSAFYYAYEDHLLFDNRYYSKEEPPVVLDNKTLMKELVINEKVKNFAWGKLYKTNLIHDIPFEKGVLFEDVFWAHRVMHRVNKFVIVGQPFYYYQQRSDSIVAAYTPRNLDILKGLKERHKFIEEFYPELTDSSYELILKSSLTHYNLLFLNRDKDKNAIHRKEVQKYVKAHYTQFKSSVKDNNEISTQLFLFGIHPFINLAYLLLKKYVRKINARKESLERIEIQ